MPAKPSESGTSSAINKLQYIKYIYHQQNGEQTEKRILQPIDNQ